jgi:hypothetical protein
MSEPAGEVDVRTRITTLRAAQEAFLLGEGVASGVRDLVADSWERSMAAGLDLWLCAPAAAGGSL